MATADDLRRIGHEPDDPRSQLNKLEACLLAVRLAKSCPHCHLHTEVVPTSGNGWAVQTGHARGCPDHDDQ